MGGRLADLAGRRRTMLVALVLFGLASIFGGLAQSPGQLVAARVGQGVAAAALSPVALAVILVSVPEGPKRRRGVAAWGMVATGGAALGVMLSGVLTEYFDWRWVLFINVPFVLVAIGMAFVAVHDKGPRARQRLDVVGALLATTSMTLLAYGCVHAGEYAWATVTTFVIIGGAVLAGVAFVAWELRVDAPLVRISILRTRTVWVATVVIALIGSVLVASFYFASLILQNVLGYDAVSTGLAVLPFCTGVVIATLSSSRLVECFGVRAVLVVGLAVGAVGFFGFTRVEAGTGYPYFLAASIVASMGIGLCIAPTLSLGTSGAIPQEAGMVSGLLNSSRQAGGGVALAALASVATHVSENSGDHANLLADGYHIAFLLCAALLLAAAVVARVGVPRRAESASGRADVKTDRSARFDR